MNDRIIKDQIDYYDQRASEYDEHHVGGHYPQNEDFAELKEALARFRPTGKVLELACGTGEWTVRLAPLADQVTALDSSRRMIARAQAKVSRPHVIFKVADLFAWEPDQAYDVVFFSFWLSHVPSGRFEDFWALVDRALGKQGRVFFIDEGPHEEYEEDYVGDEIVHRTLLDGTVHRAVKKFWEPAELEVKLRSLGWDTRITRTMRPRFFWGEGKRAS